MSLSRGIGLAYRVLVACLVVAALMAVEAVVAFGAAPETPRVTVESYTATSASLRGVLSPNAAGQEGTYEFLYAASPTLCTGESKARRGLSFGYQGEEVHEELSGLQPHTTYTVCLLDRNLAGEETLSATETFTTSSPPVPPVPPETPETGIANAITSAGATLHGILNPHTSREKEPGFFEFIYRRSANECEGEGSTGEIAAGTGKEKESVQAEVGGLAPNARYTFCVRAWNAASQFATGAPTTFTTPPGEPHVSNEQVTRVGSNGATVTAQIETGGIPATFNVQYGTSLIYGSETVETGIATNATVTVALGGLQPNSQYHARLVVHNASGTGYGSDMVFTTYQPSVGTLPDGRLYEKVSQFGNPDTEAYVPWGISPEGPRFSHYPFESAPSGNATTYPGSASYSGGSGNEFIGAGNQYVSNRNPSGGWITTDITPYGKLHSEYVGFSSDLSEGFLKAVTASPFVATESPYQPPEINTGGVIYEVLYKRQLNGATFQPLSFTNPRRRQNIEGQFVERFIGTSQDKTHTLFEADEDLLEGSGALERELENQVSVELAEEERAERLNKEGKRAEEQAALSASKNNELYVEANGHYSLANVLPEGKIDPGATFGDSLSNVISEDGTRIYWTSSSKAALPGTIFMRENGSHTVQVSTGAAQFWTASLDGKYAFYTEDGKLWRFDSGQDSRIELAGSGEGVQGVVGINETGEDGAYVYFVTREKLSGEQNSVGNEAVEGEDNLYVYEPDAGRPGQSKITFVASLSTADVLDWRTGLENRRANITPDGRALVLESYRNLTSAGLEKNSVEEAYVYDTRDGSLLCVSCRPNGSGGSLTASSDPVEVHRWISEDGDQVFFESSAPLVVNDLNGVRDVYEWERDGSGACLEAGGCLYLISNGLGPEAFFLDASASGDDVFFETAESLVTGDEEDERVKVYDARVDGALEVSPPICTGTGCQGVPAPAPIFATPASVTFAGVGNFAPQSDQVKPSKSRSINRVQQLDKALAACHRKRRHKVRSSCEKQARKRYGKSATSGSPKGRGK